MLNFGYFSLACLLLFGYLILVWITYEMLTVLIDTRFGTGVLFTLLFIYIYFLGHDLIIFIKQIIKTSGFLLF